MELNAGEADNWRATDEEEGTDGEDMESGVSGYP